MNRGPTLISASVMLHNLQDALRDHANRPDWLEAQAKAVRGLLADLDASTLTLEELPLYRDACLALTVIEVAVRQGGIETARFTADTAAGLVDALLEATPRGGQLWEVRGGPVGEIGGPRSSVGRAAIASQVAGSSPAGTAPDSLPLRGGPVDWNERLQEGGNEAASGSTHGAALPSVGNVGSTHRSSLERGTPQTRPQAQAANPPSWIEHDRNVSKPFHHQVDAMTDAQREAARRVERGR